MLYLLKFLIFGHVCKWTAVAEGKFSSSSGGTGSIVYCFCEKCGNRRYFEHSKIGVFE